MISRVVCGGKEDPELDAAVKFRILGNQSSVPSVSRLTVIRD